jgi:ABC-type ATPase with predicted acetyltransferase domain
MATVKKKSKLNLQACINWMWTEHQGMSALMASYKEKAAEDMHKFLTWGSNACDHAAYHKWLGLYIDMAKALQENKKVPESEKLERFLKHLTENVLNESSRAVTSSGIMNNVMENFDRAAKARIVNSIREAVKYNGFF